MRICKDCKHFNQEVKTVFVVCPEKAKAGGVQTGHEMMTTLASHACDQFEARDEEWGLF